MYLQTKSGANNNVHINNNSRINNKNKDDNNKNKNKNNTRNNKNTKHKRYMIKTTQIHLSVRYFCST